MNARLLENRSRQEPDSEAALLDVLARADAPALATDEQGHLIFWNHAAERVLGRSAGQVMGRRCYDVLAGRDVFGNRYCTESCAIVAMARRGETVRPFELDLAGPAHQEQTLGVSVMRVPGAEPGTFTLVHTMQPIDRAGRVARALEQLGARGAGAEPAGAPGEPGARGPVALAKAPPLTGREREVLRWVAAGLQNKEIAQKLGISLATVRNHIHNILEKLDVHSKLEAVSLAFRQGWVGA